MWDWHIRTQFEPPRLPSPSLPPPSKLYVGKIVHQQKVSYNDLNG